MNCPKAAIKLPRGSFVGMQPLHTTPCGCACLPALVTQRQNVFPAGRGVLLALTCPLALPAPPSNTRNKPCPLPTCHLSLAPHRSHTTSTKPPPIAPHPSTFPWLPPIPIILNPSPLPTTPLRPPPPPPRYQALRRKVGGTARDYWKDWVEEEQVKTIKVHYKPDDAAGTVPYLPFLIGVVVAMLGTTIAVVAQTS